MTATKAHYCDPARERLLACGRLRQGLRAADRVEVTCLHCLGTSAWKGTGEALSVAQLVLAWDAGETVCWCCR